MCTTALQSRMSYARPCRMLQVVAGGRLRPAEELAAIFQGAGVDVGQPTVCSCGSGVTAAILALALHQLSPANQVRAHV